jgi:hypothetical protein
MTESNRIYKEFQRLYQLRPELNIRANDKMFLKYEGPELFTAENAILWLDNPEFRNSLAVMRETPSEALDNFMQANPGFACESNRRLILARVGQTNESVQQAAIALNNQKQLAFNQDVVDELRAKAEAEERPLLIEEIVLDFSLDKPTQDDHRKKLQAASLPIETLRQRAQEIRDRHAFRKMSKEDLRKIVRGSNKLQVQELPAQYTREHLLMLANTDINAFKEVCNRWGHETVNARLAGDGKA